MALTRFSNLLGGLLLCDPIASAPELCNTRSQRYVVVPPFKFPPVITHLIDYFSIFINALRATCKFISRQKTVTPFMTKFHHMHLACKMAHAGPPHVRSHACRPWSLAPSLRQCPPINKKHNLYNVLKFETSIILNVFFSSEVLKDFLVE